MFRVNSPYMLDTLPRILNRSLRALITVIIRAQAIHTDTAHKGALAFCETDVRENVGGGDVDGGVVAGGCGAVGERACDDAGVDSLSDEGAREAGFERECVGV